MKLKIFALLLAALLLCGCQPAVPVETAVPTEPVMTVGLCLPGRSHVWEAQAQRLTTALEAQGLQVRLEYGADDVLLQQSQIQGLLNLPVDCLVLAAYDPLTVCQTLEDAAVPVLAYDRMLQMWSGVDGFVMADYYDAGRQLAEFALAQYPDKEQITLELLMGQSQDPNSLLFYEGVMGVLQPLLDSGKAVCLSERTRFEDVCLTRGDLEEARDISYDYLSWEYENTFPDVVICGSDAMAEGCIQALEGMAFSPEEAWPVVLGVGGTEDGLRLLEAGSLTATATVDGEELAAACANWALALLEGQLPQGDTVHNGEKDVPGALVKMKLMQ